MAAVKTPEVTTDGEVEFFDYADLKDRIKPDKKLGLEKYVGQSVLIWPPIDTVEIKGKKNVVEHFYADIQPFDKTAKKVTGPRERLEIPRRILDRVRGAFNITGGSRPVYFPITQGKRGLSLG